MDSDPLVSTAERTLRLIELLLESPEGLTAQELQGQLDLSRSSLFLMLRTLKTLGYIDQSEKRGRYRPGLRLEAWRSSPTPAARDLLAAFYQQAGHLSWPETLVLALPSPQGLLVMAQVEGTAQVRSAFIPGQPQAGLEAARAVLRPKPPLEVLENGYCLDVGVESLELALPVCRDGFHPEAALTLSAPAFRWQPENLLKTFLPEMRTMAARLSYQLGAPVYSPYRTQSELTLPASRSLSEAEMASFLQGPWTARLACVRPDGRPHVIPVWQEWDGEIFHVIAWKGSQWAEFVLQNPHISLTIDEPWPPLRRVVVRGEAQAVASNDRCLDLPALLRRMAHRYLGQEAAGSPSAVRLAFSIRPEVLRGWQGLSTSAQGE
jgi:DNA-binding IclR family transcriptional regulator/nitroimidazol reductase NimA-like FMN-containing flavoprotein (pyridoxamine 5'-phosphate oxidase superfamily)